MLEVPEEYFNSDEGDIVRIPSATRYCLLQARCFIDVSLIFDLMVPWTVMKR